MAKKKKSASKTFHLYKIDWDDARADGGWKNIEDAVKEIKPLIIHSVGWKLAETKNHVLLAQSISSVGKFADTIQIPTAWIKKKKKMGASVEYKDTKN